ncbi:MAG: hypothetical protein ACREGG_03705 [Candidatus Saccharimonadales bacterium]
MLLIFHLGVALGGLIATTVSYFDPSKRKLHIAYGLVILTLASGTYLVVTTHQPLLSSCVSGLLYLGVALVGIISAQRKLSHQKSHLE